MTPIQSWIVSATIGMIIACGLTSWLHLWHLSNRHAREVESMVKHKELLIAALERVMRQHDLMFEHPADETCYANSCPISVDHVRAVLEMEKEK